MWAQTAFRKARLKSARDEWRLLRPNEVVPKGRVAKEYLEFHSGRKLAPGLEYGIHVQLMAWEDSEPMLRVRHGLRDGRVGHLRQEIQGLANEHVVNCDVLAAHNCLHGRKVQWAPPVCQFDAPDKELFEHLTAYSKRLDDLWEARGGCDEFGFRSLALWLLWHRHKTGVGTGDMGEACAAYLYGDIGLALTLLLEYEAIETRLANEDSRPIRQEVFSKIKTDIAKLRGMIERSQAGAKSRTL